MYKKILVPLENGPADAAILHHIRPLAKLTGASLVLMHVADGWVARNFRRLNLAESDEMKKDRAYLASQEEALMKEGFAVEHVLAMGEPADEIVAIAEKYGVDLIAMSTHGHRFIADFLYGSTADKVRHVVDIPVLMVRA